MLESLRSRLALSNLLLALMGLLLVVALSTYLLAQRSFQANQDKLARQSRALAGQVEALYGRNGSTRDLEVLVRSASRILGQRVVIVDPRDRIRVDSDRATPFATGTWRQLDQDALSQGKSARV